MTVDGIEIITGLGHVRRRPGMYIGGTDARSLHNLVWECVGNVIDLHLARNATELRVEVRKDGWIEVTDDGPGIPTELTPFGVSFLEDVFSSLRAPRQRSPHVHVSTDAWGIGLAVVSALSARLDVETTTGGSRWSMGFERGEVAATLRSLGTSDHQGTTIRFLPDPTIFETTTFDASAIARRLQELAWMFPLLRVFLDGVRISGRGGLRAWARDRATTAVAEYAVYDGSDGVAVDIGLAWTNTDRRSLLTFVNTLPTTEGTHLDGLWEGLARVTSRDVPTVKDALGRGLVGILHVTLLGAEYGSPTKDQLVTPVARTAVRSVIERDLPRVLERDATLRTVLTSRLP